MIDPRSPCIIGIARKTWRTSPAPEPLTMWAAMARQAVDDSGASSILELHRRHPPGALHELALRRCSPTARRCPALDPGVHRDVRTRRDCGPADGELGSGAHAAWRLRGRPRVGGEALHTRRQILASGDTPRWSHPTPDPSHSPIDLDEWISPTEWAHDVIQPTVTFAALDTARRAHVGMKPQDYAAVEGQLLSRLTAVAASNEHAWFPIRREPDGDHHRDRNPTG